MLDPEATLFYAKVGRISFNGIFNPLDFLHAIKTRTLVYASRSTPDGYYNLGSISRTIYEMILPRINEDESETPADKYFQRKHICGKLYQRIPQVKPVC